MPSWAEKTLKYKPGEKLLKAPFAIYLDFLIYLIPLTKEEKKVYKKQEKCHICEEKFCLDKDDENYTNRKKVKDHCHYTRKFRGASHSKCNLNYKVPKDFPIIIHNASYDTHFIINQLAEEFKGELNCIVENMEKIYYFFCTS